MRITRWGEYGALCCIYMARAFKNPIQKRSVGASELSESLNIPLQYLQQILQRLRKGGLIRSMRGPGGGYILALEPNKISLKEILEAAEGDTFEIVCDSKGVFHECAGENFSCSLKPVWHELKSAVDNLLSSKTLDQLAEASVTKADLVNGLVNINVLAKG